jgi:urease accessory protein
MTAAALLLIADGRFPGGGHAHSGGLEAAVADGSVDGIAALERFLAARLVMGGEVDAWLAAAACAGVDDMALDAEADARCPSPALRVASRRLGRGLRRGASAAWPAVGESTAEHHAVVIGLVARAAGLAPDAAALLPVRLLPIDSANAMAVASRLAPLADRIAAAGATAAADGRPVGDGPAWSAPLLEARAEAHARWEVRLFAS